MLEYRVIRVKDYETKEMTDYIISDLVSDIDYERGLFIETRREKIAGSFYTVVEWNDGCKVEEAKNILKSAEKRYEMMYK